MANEVPEPKFNRGDIVRHVTAYGSTMLVKDRGYFEHSREWMYLLENSTDSRITAESGLILGKEGCSISGKEGNCNE